MFSKLLCTMWWKHINNNYRLLIFKKFQTTQKYKMPLQRRLKIRSIRLRMKWRIKPPTFSSLKEWFGLAKSCQKIANIRTYISRTKKNLTKKPTPHQGSRFWIILIPNCYFTAWIPLCVGTTGRIVPSGPNSNLSIHTSRWKPAEPPISIPFG